MTLGALNFEQWTCIVLLFYIVFREFMFMRERFIYMNPKPANPTGEKPKATGNGQKVANPLRNEELVRETKESVDS